MIVDRRWSTITMFIAHASVALLACFGALGPKTYKHPVTIWIPPYAVAKSKAQLALPGLSDGITHLSLQFWVPTKAGKAVLSDDFPEVTDKAVADLRDWSHARGLRAMLCVFNGAKTWDWPLAKAAFVGHPDEFAASLVSEMGRLELDGIDIDLEGPAQYEADKPAFVDFMVRLSKLVRAKHKQLSVASFCYQWNAPNQGWWPELFPLVDSVTSMGYQDTGLGAKTWGAYSAQIKAAGKDASKLQIGVLSDRDKWQGNSALEQLEWIQKNGEAGVGIWDAQLGGSAWKTAPIWKTLRSIGVGDSAKG